MSRVAVLLAVLLVGAPARGDEAAGVPRGLRTDELVARVMAGAAVERSRAEAELRRRGVRMVHAVRDAMAKARGAERSALERLARALVEDHHRRHQPPGMIYVPAGMLQVPRTKYPWGPGTERLRVPAFYLDRTEVTVGAWRAWRAHLEKTSPRSLGRSAPKPHKDLPAAMPVTRITWEEALRFAKEFREGRLPTVAEFERATRGSGLATWPWGADYREGHARIGLTSDDGPVPVGSFSTTGGPFGALDVVGNVAEWTATTRQAGRAARSRRALLFGGSYRDTPDPGLTWRSPRKAAATTGDRRPWIGFRVARDCPPIPPRNAR